MSTNALLDLRDYALVPASSMHEQSTPDTVWTANHGIRLPGTLTAIAYDDAGIWMPVESVTSIDEEHAVLNFSAPVSGRALVFMVGCYSAKSLYVENQLDLGGTELSGAGGQPAGNCRVAHSAACHSDSQQSTSGSSLIMTAQIAFYTGNDKVFNKLVNWWTRGPYSHTELVIDGKWYSASFLDGGVRVKEIDPHPGHWDIVDAPWVDTEAAVKWFESHMGAKYDVMGLVGFVLRNVADDRDKFFCSEAVAAAVGFTETWRLDPNTFAAVVKRMSP